MLRAEFTALAAFCGALLPGWRARPRRALLKTCCCASRLNREPPGAAGALGVPALVRPAGAAVALPGLGVERSPIPGRLAAGALSVLGAERGPMLGRLGRLAAGVEVQAAAG